LYVLAVECQCPVIRSRSKVSGPPPPGEGRALDGDHTLTVRLQGFAREAIEQESARLGVSVEELAVFALQYYLADVDSGRIARRIARSPTYPDASDTAS
jgi:hypothetical protein